jgi:hypothetical protein
MYMPVDSMLSIAATLRAVQSLTVIMERWSREHCAFAMESYFKNNDSAIQTNVILGSTLMLEEMIRFRCVKPFQIE